MEGIKDFTSFTYKTKDGETLQVSKKDGMVTIVGDKNGVRQLPLDKFWKEFIATIPKVDKTPNKDIVSLSSQKTTSADATVTSTLNTKTISGNIEGQPFKLTHKGKFIKSDTLTGNIGTKPVNLKYNEGLSGIALKGIIGKAPVDIEIKDGWSGYTITGNFKGRKINIKYNNKLIGGSTFTSENMNLTMKKKSLLSKDVNISGKFNGDSDLIPVLMELNYVLENRDFEKLALLSCAAASAGA